MAAALERNSTLTSLNLKENGIGTNGATAMAAALERNSTLTSLDLKANKGYGIGTNGGGARAQLHPYLPHP
jgi:hypothetical protein